MSSKSQNAQDFQDFVIDRLSTMQEEESEAADCSKCVHYKRSKCSKQKYNNIALFHGVTYCWKLCTVREKLSLILISRTCEIN